MIELLSYYLLSLVILILKGYEIINDTDTIALFITVGVLAILGMFIRLRWLRRRAGEIIIKLEKYWIYESLGIVIIAVLYSALLFQEISRGNANRAHYLIAFTYFFPVYGVLLTIFSENIIGKKGIVHNGKVYAWDRVESYHWIESKSPFRKGFLKLLIKIEPTFWIGEITIKVKNTQKREIDLFLNSIITLKETENQRK